MEGEIGGLGSSGGCRVEGEEEVGCGCRHPEKEGKRERERASESETRRMTVQTCSLTVTLLGTAKIVTPRDVSL